MTMPGSYLLPTLPKGLEGLAELALDLRWSWNHAADSLWEYIDSDLWNTTGNPWTILQTVTNSRLKALATDADFRKLMGTSMVEHRNALGAQTWFKQTYAKRPFTVAYFSMEYGLSEALPIYSGGLGILAGDYLKTASDLNIDNMIMYSAGRAAIQTGIMKADEVQGIPLSIKGKNTFFDRIRPNIQGETKPQ